MLFIVNTYGFLLRTHIGKKAAAGCEYVVHLLLEKIHAIW